MSRNRGVLVVAVASALAALVSWVSAVPALAATKIPQGRQVECRIGYEATPQGGPRSRTVLVVQSVPDVKPNGDQYMRPDLYGVFVDDKTRTPDSFKGGVATAGVSVLFDDQTIAVNTMYRFPKTYNVWNEKKRRYEPVKTGPLVVAVIDANFGEAKTEDKDCHGQSPRR